MDSTGMPTAELPAQYQTLQLLMPIILGLIVMPLVGFAKKLSFVGKDKLMDPVYIKVAFLILSLWGMSQLIPPAMTFKEAVDYGLMLSGGVLLAYRTIRKFKPKPQT